MDLVQVADSHKILYEDSPFSYYNLIPGERDAGRSQADQINNSDGLFVGDFDGDGKSDICLIGTNNTKVYSFSISNSISSTYTSTSIARSTYKDRFMIPGDFNGDGKMDLILAPIFNSSSNSWNIYSSTGLGFYSTPVSIYGAYNKDKMTYGVQDLNRDGITDLTKTDQSISGATNFTMYGIFNGKSAGTAYISLTKNSITVPVSLQSFNEFNSMIVLSPSGGKVARYSYNNDFLKENVLTGFTNSYGVKTSFSYNRLNEYYNSNGTFYTSASNAIFPFMNYSDGALLMTTSMQEQSASSIVKNEHYRYHNAISHKQGLGFQGFERFSVTDVLSYTKSEETTYNPFRWGVMIGKKSMNGSVFDHRYEYTITDNTNKTKRILPKKKTEKNLLSGFTSIVTYPSYDAYGNPLTEITDYGGEIKTTITKKYNNHTGPALYLLGEVYEESEKKEVDGMSCTTKTTFAFNVKRQPTSIKVFFNDNLLEEATNTYNTSYFLTEFKKKKFASTATSSVKYTYNAEGKVLREVNSLGLWKDHSYNAKGELASVNDNKGLETKYDYDGWGNINQITYPDGGIKSTKLAWSSYGLISETTSQTGSPTTVKYIDALNRVIRSSEIRFDSKELKTDFQYDVLSRVVKASVPFTETASLWNTIAYDSYDRRTKATYASGKIDTYSYNKNVEISVVDSVTVSKTVNQLEQVISMSDASGTTIYKYRPDEQQSTITTADGVITTFSYDTYGRQNAISDPSSGKRTFAYDVNGNISQETDARGKSISMTYDNFERLIDRTVDGVKATFKFNTNGLLESIISTDGYSTYFQVTTAKDLV